MSIYIDGELFDGTFEIRGYALFHETTDSQSVYLPEEFKLAIGRISGCFEWIDLDQYLWHAKNDAMVRLHRHAQSADYTRADINALYKRLGCVPAIGSTTVTPDAYIDSIIVSTKWDEATVCRDIAVELLMMVSPDDLWNSEPPAL